MNKLLTYLQGDKTIWAVTAVLALFSFMPVYSASTNLVYVLGAGTTGGHLVKHAVLLGLGFVIMYFVHNIPYRYFSGGSILLMPIVIGLLIYTLLQGTTIAGANASRWIRIPFVGVGFQTSTLAGLVLLIYVSRYLSRNKNETIGLKESLLQLWLPIGGILFLILPANFSTTAIIFSMVILLLFLGGYPWKYLLMIFGVAMVAFSLFVLTAKAFPSLMPNRVDTWVSRVASFSNDNIEGYQVQKAKIAIATGDLIGKGPGKSVQKNFLPQSTSDFIFAIIVEEYGLIGAFMLIFLYFLLLFRMVIVARKTRSVFATLLVVSAGVPIIFQAIINMAVAVNLLPVTGQTLPLISSGGTSIWMTCFAIGIILSVSKDNQLREENEEIEA